MTKVVIFGRDSQIGIGMSKNIFFNKKNIIFLNKEQLNITDEKLIKEVFKKNNPDILINLSAFTDVDKAELNKQKALEINGYALENLSLICNNYNCILIHFSTDYIYDGKKNTKYSEDDLANPKTIYGISKLIGEKIIKEKSKTFLILRISHLYSNYKKNIVLNIYNSMKLKNINVVNDNSFIPTSYKNIENFLIYFIKNYKFYSNIKKTFNFCDDGDMTNPYEICKYINKKTNILSNENIKTISYSDYKKLTKRPRNTMLDNAKFKEYFKFTINDWKSEIDLLLKNIMKV